MSSNLNNNAMMNGQGSLPLPPKRKTTGSQLQMLFPIAPAGSMPNTNTNMLHGGFPNFSFAPASGVNPLAFLNQGVYHHQHQLSGNPTGTATCSKRHPFGSFKFFEGWKLRSGKWLEEEEAYAELLIQMFDKGFLADCMTGATLRAYLAQKLHCAPMRISKKYAGKCIGKKVYSCKMDTRKNVPPAYAEQRRKLQQKVEEAQKKFHESAFADAPEIQPTCPPMSGFMTMMATSSGMPYGMAPMANAAQQLLQQGTTPPNFFTMNQAASFLANQQQPQQQQQGMQNFATMENVASSFPIVPTNKTVPSGTTPSPAAAPIGPCSVACAKQQLQESYAKAIGSHAVNDGTNASLPAAPSTNNQTGNAQGVQSVAVNPSLSMMQNSTIQQTNQMLGNQKQTNATNQPPLRIDPPPETHFPDFMAGFDTITNHRPLDQNELQCSPPFTSRSFDEFHRFLGKDLSPLDEGNESSHEQTEVGMELHTDDKAETKKLSLDTTALFTAESYAMFAQQSAVAASQHAAYLSQSHHISPRHSATPGSFDFDNTMKLVSHHVPIAPRPQPANDTTLKPEAKSKPVPVQPGATDKNQTRARLNSSMYDTHTTRPSESAIVSGSEPTSSATESSLRGSSESNASYNNSSNSDCRFGSEDDSNSSDGDFSIDDAAYSQIDYKRQRREDSLSLVYFDGRSIGDRHGGCPSSDSQNRQYKKQKLSKET